MSGICFQFCCLGIEKAFLGINSRNGLCLWAQIREVPGAGRVRLRFGAVQRIKQCYNLTIVSGTLTLNDLR